MSEEAKTLSFASEEEEADWWYDNREALNERFVKAYHEGKVEVNGLKRRVAAARGIQVLDLSADDISKAQVLAEQRGMEMGNLLNLLMHEILERETQSSAGK